MKTIEEVRRLQPKPSRWDKWRASINRKVRAIREHAPRQLGQIVDVVDIAFIVGVFFIGYGIYGYSPRIAFIVCGGLILLSIRPVIYWFIR